MTNEAWGKLREDLIKRVGRNNYTTWIEPIRLAELRGSLARFEVPTSFFGDWVSRNFSDHILKHLNASGQEVSRLEFFVPSASAPAPRNVAAPVKARPKLAQRRSGADDDLPGMPPPAGWQRADRSPLTRCSSMAAWVWARPT
jgi:chromosomal replication initiator protein